MVFPEWKRTGWEPYYGRMSKLHQPCVGGYPREAMVAEKFEAIVVLGNDNV